VGVTYLDFENSGAKVEKPKYSEKNFPKIKGEGVNLPILELKYRLRPPIARCQNCAQKPLGEKILWSKFKIWPTTNHQNIVGLSLETKKLLNN